MLWWSKPEAEAVLPLLRLASQSGLRALSHGGQPKGTPMGLAAPKKGPQFDSHRTFGGILESLLGHIPSQRLTTRTQALLFEGLGPPMRLQTRLFKKDPHPSCSVAFLPQKSRHVYTVYIYIYIHISLEHIMYCTTEMVVTFPTYSGQNPVPLGIYETP